jgi:hypothetical protein
MPYEEQKSREKSLSRRMFNDIVKRHPGSDYATQVRGLAALAVFAVHAEALAPILNNSHMGGGGFKRYSPIFPISEQPVRLHSLSPQGSS